MPNHVHLIVVPLRADSLARLFGEAHRRYTRLINERHEWQGHLWQDRFHSTVLDERYLLAAVRYVELNPVRAGLCRHPEAWRWSSVHAHMAARDDLLVTVKPMLELVEDWGRYLEAEPPAEELDALRGHTRSGKPLGGDRIPVQIRGSANLNKYPVPVCATPELVK